MEVEERADPLPVRAVLVQAVELQTTGVTSWEVYERTHDLLTAVAEDGRLTGIGPWEVARLSTAGDGPYYETSTLGSVVDGLGLPRDTVLVLTPSVTTRVATLRGEGRSKHATTDVRSAEGELIVTLMLRHAATGAMLATAQLGRPVDPLDVRQDADRAPWMSRALLDALTAMLDESQRTLALAPPRKTANSLILQENPRAGFSFRAGGRESFSEHLATLDAVSAEAERFVRYERMDEDADTARLQRYDDGPLGLIVEYAPDGWPLRRDDTIVSVDGRPVARAPEWARALQLRRPGAPLRVGILRGEARKDVSVPPELLEMEPTDPRVDTSGPLR